MNDTSSFHKENLRHAKAMEQGRKQILNILCGSQAALQVLAQDYAAIKPSDTPLDELLHVDVHRFADDDVAEKVVRNRAERVAKRCMQLSKGKTISAIDRCQLVDEIYDIRLPDSQMATIPDRALEAKFCDAEHAGNLKLQISKPKRHVWEARAQLTETNLPLLRRFLYGYRERPDFEDIQSEGKLGLMTAADRWDPESRMRFSTYAVPYIYGYAQKYVYNQGSLIRVPINTHTDLNKLQRVETKHLARYGEIPSVPTVAATLGFKRKKVEELRGIRRDDRPYEHPELYDVNWSAPRRTQAVVSPQILEQETERKECEKHILKVLRTLTPREERVVKLHFGLGGEEEKTLEEVGQSFGVTRERARQIEAKALRRLRHPSRARGLSSFVPEYVRFEEREAQKEARRQMKEAETAARKEGEKEVELAELREALKDPHVRTMLQDPRLGGFTDSALDELARGETLPRPRQQKKETSLIP